MTSIATAPSTTAADWTPSRSRPVRIWLAGMGLLSVSIGAIGVFVPGLPTTIFLIIASWCFARSCPWLEERLLHNRFFAPFMRYLSPGAAMPTRARVVSTVMIWLAVLSSAGLLISRETSPWIIVAVLVAAVVGTVAVWRVARPATAQASAEGA